MADHHAKDTWTVFKIMGEFVEGFETLRPVWPSVSIFGSARITSESPYYTQAQCVAARLSEAGFSIITGGGPGVMAAANQGASEAEGEGRSIGLPIRLPLEQKANEFIDTQVDFNFFFARKVMFVKYACGFVALPGGFGTLDEVFEALTLIQTRKIHDFPVVLFGSEYWKGLADWLAVSRTPVREALRRPTGSPIQRSRPGPSARKTSACSPSPTTPRKWSRSSRPTTTIAAPGASARTTLATPPRSPQTGPGPREATTPYRSGSPSQPNTRSGWEATAELGYARRVISQMRVSRGSPRGSRRAFASVSTC